MITGDSEAIQVGSYTRKKPSFIIIRKHRFNKGVDEEGELPEDDSSLRHEFHHFISNFLQRGEFFRKPAEATPELSESFRWFREELSAYIIEGRKLAGVDAYAMTYSENREIQNQAEKTKYFAFVCLELARGMGNSTQDFLYPIMTARNFSELQANMLEFTPVAEQVDEATVGVLYDTWRRSRQAEDGIVAVLQGKHASIAPETLSIVAQEKMSGLAFYGEFPYLRDLQVVATDLAQFATAVTMEGFSVQDALAQSLRGKLPFPDEVIQEMLAMPFQAVQDVPIINDSEKFIAKFVSIWRVEDDTKRALYTKVLNATPEMRATFERMREGIIERYTKFMNIELSYEKQDKNRKREIDDEIQRKTALFRSL